MTWSYFLCSAYNTLSLLTLGNGVPVLLHTYSLYVYLLKHQPANLANINKHTMSKKRTYIFIKIALKDNAFTWVFFLSTLKYHP